MHSSRQTEAAVVTYRHTMGENSLGLNRSWNYISKSFKKCSISNDIDGTEDDILWDEQHDKSDSDEEGNKMHDDT